jgi:transcriptional regulator with XRE-family HTH domain
MSIKYSNRYKEVGIKISEYRKKRKLTQEELANQVGISYSYIIQIEAPNVEKRMSLEVLFDIANALNIDVKDLL